MFTKENWFKILLWLVVIFCVTNWICNLLTMPSSIANIFGVILFLVTIYISVKTVCFLKITFKKDKKNEEAN
jgi:hypothetical protein